MTDMEYHASLPELPSQEELPEWITANINDAVGFDRYKGIEGLDPNGLDLELMMLEHKLNEFNNDLKPIKGATKAAQENLDRLLKFAQNMQLKIQRIQQRADNIEATAQPKINALEERKHMLEQAIRVREAAKRQQALYDKLISKFEATTGSMPWASEIKPHQKEGSLRMAFNSMILADDVGLGKTLTSIAACDNIKAKTADGDANSAQDFFDGNLTQPPAGRRILYLAPAPLSTNIRKEYQKWAQHRGNPVYLAKQSRNGRRLILEALKGTVDCVVIVNYEAWRKDKLFINDLIEMEFDTVILDEAHTIKERDKIGYRGVAHLLNGKDFTQEDNESKNSGDCQWSPRLQPPMGGEYMRPRYVYPMTGTPILNRPQEFFTLLTLVDPVNFPCSAYGESNFLRTYCTNDPYSGRWFFADGALEKLSKQISNLYLRRTQRDAGIELPPQDIQYHELEIDEEAYPQQAQARRDMREYAALMLDPDSPIAKASNSMVVRLRLRQIETMPSGIKFMRVDDWGNEIEDTFNVKESQKLDYIIHENSQGYDGLLPEVCPQQRTVVYSQFIEPLEEMHRRALAAGLRSVVFYGKGHQYSMTDAQEEELKKDIDRYYVDQNNGQYKYDVVFAHYRVGGTGLNFNHFTQTIIIDEEWNPGKRDQAYGRTNRMGQTEETTVHVIRMKQTIDLWMSELIAGKEDMITKFNTKNALREALRKGEI